MYALVHKRLNMGTVDKTVSYTVRFTPELWRKLQSYITREEKRIGRTQIIQDILRQALDLGLAQLEGRK